VICDDAFRVFVVVVVIDSLTDESVCCVFTARPRQLAVCHRLSNVVLVVVVMVMVVVMVRMGCVPPLIW